MYEQSVHTFGYRCKHSKWSYKGFWKHAADTYTYHHIVPRGTQAQSEMTYIFNT